MQQVNMTVGGEGWRGRISTHPTPYLLTDTITGYENVGLRLNELCDHVVDQHGSNIR